MPPMGPKPNSGQAEPMEPKKNSTAETSSAPLRPNAVDSGPATAAPITQPSSAQEMVQPESQPVQSPTSAAA